MSKFICSPCSKGIHVHPAECLNTWTDSTCDCAEPTNNTCIGCKAPLDAWRIYCYECYLLKECLYAINDIRTENPGFQEWALKRLINYAEFRIEKVFNLKYGEDTS